MREIRFKGKRMKRLPLVRVIFYLMQLAAVYDKPIPSENEMKYIRRMIAELQLLGLRYDAHCLQRDWANDERNGHAPRTSEDYRNTWERMERKWQCKTSKRQRLEWFPFSEKF